MLVMACINGVRNVMYRSQRFYVLNQIKNISRDAILWKTIQLNEPKTISDTVQHLPLKLALGSGDRSIIAWNSCSSNCSLYSSYDANHATLQPSRYQVMQTKKTLSSGSLAFCFADPFADILPVKGVSVSLRGWIRARWTIFTLLSQLYSMTLSQRFIRSGHSLSGTDQSFMILIFASLLILTHQSSQRTPADDVSWHRRKASAISL